MRLLKPARTLKSIKLSTTTFASQLNKSVVCPNGGGLQKSYIFNKKLNISRQKRRIYVNIMMFFTGGNILP